MAEQELPVTRTPISLSDFIKAVIDAWSVLKDPTIVAKVGDVGDIPPKGAVAVLYGQYMIETGGTSIFNFNVGNVKHVTGDGFDFHSLRGVWEIVSPAEAERLISSGQAIADPSADHAKAAGEGKVSVVLLPGSPGTRFRAFHSAAEGIAEHLKFLTKRFSGAWPSVMAGDVTGFANALRKAGYFTASAESYARGMQSPFNQVMASGIYDSLVASARKLNPVATPLVAATTTVARAVAITSVVGGSGWGLWKLWQWWKGH